MRCLALGCGSRARALALGPELLICDEPTSALDPISAQHIEKRLLELKRQYTIVLVTHILRQARRIAEGRMFEPSQGEAVIGRGEYRAYTGRVLEAEKFFPAWVVEGDHPLARALSGDPPVTGEPRIAVRPDAAAAAVVHAFGAGRVVWPVAVRP